MKIIRAAINVFGMIVTIGEMSCGMQEPGQLFYISEIIMTFTEIRAYGSSS